jgi:endothelin-converting enzyme/putative endopeptidase
MRHILLCAPLLASLASAEPPASPSSPPAPLEARPGVQRFDPHGVDESVGPCEDFYSYACNEWLAANPIPPDRGTFGRGSQIYLRNQFLIRDVLEQAASATDRSEPATREIGDYYQACMDEGAIGKKGLQALAPELGPIEAMKSKADLPARLAHLHLVTTNLLPASDSQTPTAFFGFGSSQDLADASKVILATDQGGLALPDKDYYLKDDAKSAEIRDKYRQHVRRMFELAGDSPASAAAEAAVVLDIETALAHGSMDIVTRRDPANLNHPMPIEQLQKLSPDFDWGAYLKALDAPTPAHYLVLVPDFVKAFDQQVATRSLVDIETYLRWNLLHASASLLPEAFANESFDFFGRTLGGAKELPPRWKRCGTYVDRDLGEALGQAFVRKNFPKESKERMLALVGALESSMKGDIEGLAWMGPATQTAAVGKLHAILDKIGYPDQWRDYGSIALPRDDALGNAFRAGAFEGRRQLAKVGKPVDRKEWGMTPPTVDAYYNPQMNTINFPAGILQPPLFDATMDDAVNFGGIGTVIGHELTHGFDDQGRKFDGDGNLRDWWTPEDGKAFEQRATCTADQYSGYVATADVHLDGRLTLGENTADAGGARIAYLALLDLLAKTGRRAERIDGLTPDQRFFLAYASGWCRNMSDASLRLMATTDPHSPPRYRVNGVLSNMPEFRETWGCKAGDAMVRENQCRVW